MGEVTEVFPIHRELSPEVSFLVVFLKIVDISEQGG